MIVSKILKNGKVRLYQIHSALVEWRGSNDKAVVVRDESGNILTFNSLDEAKAYAKDRLDARVCTDWEF
jgi:hypothetical protein